MISNIAYDLTLHKNKQGTLVKYQLELTPQSLLAKLTAPLFISNKIQTRMQDFLQRIDSNPDQPQKTTRLSPRAQVKLTTASDELITEGFLPEWIENVTTELGSAPDGTLEFMRPYAYADRWAMPRKRIFELFLAYADRSILIPYWVVSCTHCQRQTVTLSSLKKLQASMPCSHCKESFNVDLDDNVELAFRPHKAIRRLNEHSPSFRSPIEVPRILAQQQLSPNELFSAPLILRPGHYCALTPESNPSQWGMFTIEQTGRYEVFVEVSDEGIKVITHNAEKHSLLKLANKTKSPQRVIIESHAWKQQRITAAAASCCQYFRSHWGQGEVAKPNVIIPVSKITILISDLVASTALCASLGDESAYIMTRKVYDFHHTVINNHDGAIIKTMGDAIIAAFHSPACAVTAALAIQQELLTFNATQDKQQPVNIRLGIHHGPSLAVNLNNQLDFFGTTVNLTGCFRGLCDAGELVVSKALLEDSTIQDALNNPNIVVKDDVATVGSISKAIKIARISQKN